MTYFISLILKPNYKLNTKIPYYKIEKDHGFISSGTETPFIKIEWLPYPECMQPDNEIWYFKYCFVIPLQNEFFIAKGKDCKSYIVDGFDGLNNIIQNVFNKN